MSRHVSGPGKHMEAHVLEMLELGITCHVSGPRVRCGADRCSRQERHSAVIDNAALPGQLEETQRAAALYRAQHIAEPSASFAAWLRQILDEKIDPLDNSTPRTSSAESSRKQLSASTRGSS